MGRDNRGGNDMARRQRLSLFVFIDAFGWELVSRYGFLDNLIKRRAPMGTIFGYSSTCVPTILTGKLPREHGHFAFYRYDPKHSPFKWYRPLQLLPEAIASRARVRNQLSRVVERLHGFTGYFQLYNMPFKYLHLFDYSEKRDLYRPGGINGGAPTLFAALEERGVPYALPSWRLTDDERYASARKDIENAAVPFAFLFFGKLDGLLHYHGTGAQQVQDKIREYERMLTELVETARKGYEDVRLFVFSDHGMTDTTTPCDVIGRIERLGLRFGVDYAAAYDSTMARFWFMSAEARKRIEDALAQEPNGRALSEATLAEWGCDFPGHAYGELFFLCNPGRLLCPSFMGARPITAMHGYDPFDKDSIAAFQTSVEDVELPTRLDGVFNIMKREALGE